MVFCKFERNGTSLKTKIYIADADALSDKELFLRCYNAVDIQRRRKTDKYYFDKDKRLSLAAGVLLLCALREHGIESPEFAFGENGKPYIKNCTGFYFNLSHSGSRAVCAVSDSEVGCDVEIIKEAHLDLAKKFFSKDECFAVENAPSKEDKKSMFYRIWTGKESYIKATGEGMKEKLSSFSVLSDSVGEYGIIHLDYFDGYSYSICRKGGISLSASDAVCVDISEVIKNKNIDNG